jgi:hypothetical protein
VIQITPSDDNLWFTFPRDEAPPEAKRRRILESDNVATFSEFRPLR